MSLWSVEHCCEGKELFTYSFNFQTEVVKNSIDAKFCLRQNNSKLTLYYFGSGKLRYFSQWIMSTRRDINNFSWKELILMLPGTVPSPGSILFPWFLDTTSQCQYLKFSPTFGVKSKQLCACILAWPDQSTNTPFLALVCTHSTNCQNVYSLWPSGAILNWFTHIHWLYLILIKLTGLPHSNWPSFVLCPQTLFDPVYSLTLSINW